MTHYLLPAAKDGVPGLLPVEAGYQREYLGFGSHRPTLVLGKEESARPEEDSAREIADDLLNEWSHPAIGMGTGLGPGIFICAGVTPTDEEIQPQLEKQIAWAQYIVDKADELWITGKRDEVKEGHRKAALWLGRDREWAQVGRTQLLTKACPYCGTTISGAAPVCPTCHRVHDPNLMKEVEQRLGEIKARIKEVEAVAPAAQSKPAEPQAHDPKLVQPPKVYETFSEEMKDRRKTLVKKS